jgi:hypothetical protein
MALTKDHKYIDSDCDTIEDQTPADEAVEEDGALGLVYLPNTGGTYILPKFSVPLALNVLGHDRPVDERVSTGRFDLGGATAYIADNQAARDHQVNLAAALLTAVDAYDQRATRLATAEERRQKAAESLTASVVRIKLERGDAAFGNAEIGKLREALGRYDAELDN